MALSGAERARKCREKKKAAGLGESMKQKDRQRKRLARSKMLPKQLNELRLRQQTNLQKYRSKLKQDAGLPSPATSSFSTKQSKAKVLKRIVNALPVNKNKQIELIKQVAETLNIINVERTYERKQQSLSTDTKKQVYDFYFRDDISYQAPGKKDTIIIKENGEKKTLQKRYLLYTLNELYQLFIEENPQVVIGRSSFKDLRPRNVLYESATPQNLCLCVYHENISLLLQSLNQNIHNLNSIDLNSFVKLLVCDDTQELCMFSNCTQCSFNFKRKIEEKIIDRSKIIKWSQWSISDENRTVKVEYEGTVEYCVKI